jgi:hypothetical protein
MQRSGLIKRRKSLRTYCEEKARKKKEWPAYGLKPKKEPKKQQRGLRRQSVARETETKFYYQERIVFLRTFPMCVACLARDVTPAPSAQVHHRRGRIGRLLRDQRFWTAVCAECHEWIHGNPNEARKIGLIVPVAEWNVFPR